MLTTSINSSFPSNFKSWVVRAPRDSHPPERTPARSPVLVGSAIHRTSVRACGPRLPGRPRLRKEAAPSCRPPGCAEQVLPPLKAQSSREGEEGARDESEEEAPLQVSARLRARPGRAGERTARNGGGEERHQIPAGAEGGKHTEQSQPLAGPLRAGAVCGRAGGAGRGRVPPTGGREGRAEPVGQDPSGRPGCGGWGGGPGPPAHASG